MSIQEKENQVFHQNIKRLRYNENVVESKFKDSGVKKVLLLGLSQDTEENYANISKLWNLLQINDRFKGTLATDLKLANILFGLMSHASTYPCTWCFAHKNKLEVCTTLRSMGNCLKYYEGWLASGSRQDQAKQFMNCINLPLLSGNEDILFLDVYPPPELHLMLGVVNTLIKHMLLDCPTDVEAWIQVCNVQRDLTHRGPTFKGNSCNILLKKIDLLRSSCCIKCVKYVHTFKCFGSVVQDCFGERLKETYLKSISDFKDSYMALAIPVTPKVHAVFYHVSQFCKKVQSSLGFYSEQAVESLHHDFAQIWSKYKVSKNNELYASRLLRAVSEYNSSHL